MDKRESSRGTRGGKGRNRDYENRERRDDRYSKPRHHKNWLEDAQPYGRDTYGDDDDGRLHMPERHGRHDRKKGKKSGRR